jgi:hypothetical protein
MPKDVKEDKGEDQFKDLLKKVLVTINEVIKKLPTFDKNNFLCGPDQQLLYVVTDLLQMIL